MGTPLSIATGIAQHTLDPGQAAFAAGIAIVMAVGAWVRYTDGERRRAAERELQGSWLGTRR